jgi:ABC-type oligopeptide transport system substrate-binding subunit
VTPPDALHAPSRHPAILHPGPYRVAQFVPGRRLLLVRNERFREWSRAAQPDGYPGRIEIRMDDDPGHRADAVLRGDADLALEIASANLAPLRTRYASQLRLHPQPNTSFLSFSVGNWIADYPSPSQFLDYFLSCANYHPEDPARTTNGGGFCNTQFDHLIAQAETLQPTDPATAQDIWARADRLAVDQAAWVPLANTASAELLSRRAGHFTLDADSGPQIDQLWVR